MNPKTFLGGLVALALAITAGCEPPPKAQPATGGQVSSTAQPAAPAGGLPPGVIEAKDATRVWNQSEVEEYLRNNLKLKSVTLKPAGNNGYQGTAQGQDGMNYQLMVKQVPGGIKTDWTTDTGAGSLSFGNPVP